MAGSRKGVPNKDKAELRALVQDSVLRHTQLLRDRIERGLREDPATRDLPQSVINQILDERQPLIEEYDPVVELGMMASDYSHETNLRRQANSDAAQYLRPKLKTVEHLESPEAMELLKSKQELADRLTQGLIAAMQGKSNASPPAESKKKDDEEDF